MKKIILGIILLLFFVNVFGTETLYTNRIKFKLSDTAENEVLYYNSTLRRWVNTSDVKLDSLWLRTGKFNICEIDTLTINDTLYITGHAVAVDTFIIDSAYVNKLVVHGFLTLDDGVGDSPLFKLICAGNKFLSIQKLDAGNAVFINDEGDIKFDPAGLDILLDAGLTVGSDTEAGDNNLRIEGDAHIVDSTYIGGNTVIIGTLDAPTLNTGQGDYELYAMNQDVESTDAVTFLTVNTGEGANELYDMNQNVTTTSDVVFDSLQVTKIKAGSGTDIVGFSTNTSLGTSNDSLSTQGAIKTYTDALVTAQNLDIKGDAGDDEVDLDSEHLLIQGTAGEIETTVSDTVITIGLVGTATLSSNSIMDATGTLTAFGEYAGTSGTMSAYFGQYAGQNSSSASITAFGQQAMRHNEGTSSSGFGEYALEYNKGLHAHGLGQGVLQYNIGAYSSGLGGYTMSHNTGDGCSAIGTNAMKYNNANLNSALGYDAFNTFTEDAGNAKTFVDGNVDTATDYITITGHGFGGINSYKNLKISTTGAVPTGLNAGNIYQFKVIHADTIECRSADIEAASGGGTHTLTPQTVYTNATAIGYNAEPDASNQIMLGDGNVTEVKTAGGYTAGGNVKGATYGSDSSITDAELLYINTLSSNAQTQLNLKAPLANPTFTGLVKRSVTAGITAVNPGAQGDGALTSDINEISTCGAGSDAVTLPTAVAGQV